jgi:hypothetical protein
MYGKAYGLSTHHTFLCSNSFIQPAVLLMAAILRIRMLICQDKCPIIVTHGNWFLGAVHRENFVQFDFIRFLAFLAPCFRNEDFACDHGHAVFQAALLRMVQLGG